MPRLNVVEPANATGKAKEILEGPLKAKQLNIFKGIANNGGVLEAFLGFAGGVKGAGSLTAEEHEVIALTTAAVNGCEYCAAAHTKAAQAVGLSADAAHAIHGGNAPSDKHQALLNFTKAVVETKGFVSDEQLNNFKAAGYDDAAVVEVIGGIAVNTFTNLFNHVNNTEIDSIFQPVPSS